MQRKAAEIVAALAAAGFGAGDHQSSIGSGCDAQCQSELMNLRAVTAGMPGWPGNFAAQAASHAEAAGSPERNATVRSPLALPSFGDGSGMTGISVSTALENAICAPGYQMVSFTWSSSLSMVLGAVAAGLPSMAHKRTGICTSQRTWKMLMPICFPGGATRLRL